MNEESNSTGGPQYFVVIAPGAAKCEAFDSPELVADKLRDAYERAVTAGNPDVRAFVFVGSRIPVTGESCRELALADGRKFPIVQKEVAPSDYLLSTTDRVATGGTVR